MKSNGLRSYARQLLHAFADAGQPSANDLQLFMGPNGGLIWSDPSQVDRWEPYAAAAYPAAEKSAAPEDPESSVIVRPQEPVGSHAYAALEAPASN